MSDSQRRDPKPFEPPPWEKEAFEAFQVERAAREAAEQEAVAAAEAAQRAVLEASGIPPLPEPAPVVDAVDAIAGVPAGAAPPVELPEGERVMPRGGTVDEKAVAAMMLELQVAESSDDGGTKMLQRGAAIITALIGLGMTVSGIALGMGAQGKPAIVIGSAVATVFGLIFIGMAAWVWTSSNRVRGR